MELSLVIPIYNEEPLIEPLLQRVFSSLPAITEDFEVICVDDGSRDGSLARLIECRRRDRRLKIIVLSRNFGHQAAYTAGLEHARGKYVVMMDGDLQDPPELIPDMVAKAEAGSFDIIHARRRTRQEGFFRKILMLGFHAVFRRLSGLEDVQNIGNFSLMNQPAVQALLSFREKSRYLPGLRFFIGFEQGFVEYERDSRFSGQPKMGLGLLYKLALDAIFSFSEIPIRICFFIGMAGIVICFFAFLYVIISKITGIAPFGWSSTTLSIYFMGFVQLLFLGILGEYLFRTYHETRNRPVYLIRKIIE
ncbi:MAG: glycosyltransferase family 2 protein [Desulfosudaceae bacterium]